jgi:hypothetical protein
MLDLVSSSTQQSPLQLVIRRWLFTILSTLKVLATSSAVGLYLLPSNKKHALDLNRDFSTTLGCVRRFSLLEKE